MHYLEIGLLIYLVFLFPVYELLTHKRTKQQLVQAPSKKVSHYQFIMVTLWLPTIALLYLYFNGSLYIQNIGLSFNNDWRNLLGFGLLIGFIVYSFLAWSQVQKDPNTHQQATKAFKPMEWFLPVTRTEYRWFCGPLSISAGVCEELLFRGYLINLLDVWTPLWFAVLISSAIFGSLHIYQGISGVISTAITGLVLALLYLATDSILVPILFHIMMDIYSGKQAYLVLRPQPSGYPG